MTETDEPQWRTRAEADRDLLGQLHRDHEQWAADHAEQMRAEMLGLERAMCQKIARLREDRGWSQAELARRLGELGFEMHQTTVAKLEAGKRPLRLAELYALGVIFGVPPSAMHYMSVPQEESLGMEYMRRRLQTLDETMQQSEEAVLGAMKSHAQLYAELSAERLLVADAIRRAARETEDGGGGEHREAQ